MPDNEFYAPDDVDLLRMENELLAFEVRFLKTRLGEPARIPGSSTSLNRLGYLEEAERDLVLLLRRLSGRPVGPVLRRTRSFRTLEQKYLHSPRPRSSSSPERLAYLEEAERDLILLLRRMSTSPFGRVLRRRKAFRTLEQRYL
ncbi:MAG: hypothetical protein AVDCRST_MAG22-48 [uncultured Rubrobacteraceae bacterium]|uniref:Uncharacterized protein n=1 Tax=uncultured Rubrobacteraceae bacterium TaxID=349277 RepID=A0A6J4N9Y2_9ACTN|nr:MAG: hypothetical protein AVDCRST_MAG22-48 [uncultured Rubrobacteraceae bacterium]